MVLLRPICLRVSDAQRQWLTEEAARQGHDRPSLVIRTLIAAAMKRRPK